MFLIPLLYISVFFFGGVFTAEGQAGVENENQAGGGNQAAENVNAAEPGADNGANHLWGIVREIKMIVFGFISSLLPGFHYGD